MRISATIAAAMIFSTVALMASRAAAQDASAAPTDPVIYWADEADKRGDALEKRFDDLDGVAKKMATADAENAAWIDRAREKIDDAEARARTPAELERAGRGILGMAADALPWLAPVLIGAGAFGGKKLGERGERKRHLGTADPIHAIATMAANAVANKAGAGGFSATPKGKQMAHGVAGANGNGAAMSGEHLIPTEARTQ